MAESKPDWNRIASMVQTATLVIAISGVFMALGRDRATIVVNSSDLRELGNVAQDLLKAQVTTTSNDVLHLEMLNELRRRVDAIERSQP
ncbi:MAG: hypothetical protein CMI60_01395 [Parvibaculum sp.]|nr:hypothetical protein [Parvibaculum sp.]